MMVSENVSTVFASPDTLEMALMRCLHVSVENLPLNILSSTFVMMLLANYSDPLLIIAIVSLAIILS